MFTYTRRAHYHETDKMGIVHHSNYIKWMEEARTALMDHIGFTLRRMDELGVASPVVSLSVDYKRPVEFSDIVELRLSVKKYNGVVLEFDYEFFNSSKNEVCTKASSKHCFLMDGRPVNLRQAMPEMHACFVEGTKEES